MQDVDGFHTVPEWKVVVGEDDIVGREADAFGKLLAGLNGGAVGLKSALVQGAQAELNVVRIIFHYEYLQRLSDRSTLRSGISARRLRAACLGGGYVRTITVFALHNLGLNCRPDCRRSGGGMGRQICVRRPVFFFALSH